MGKLRLRTRQLYLAGQGRRRLQSARRHQSPNHRGRLRACCPQWWRRRLATRWVHLASCWHDATAANSSCADLARNCMGAGRRRVRGGGAIGSPQRAHLSQSPTPAEQLAQAALAHAPAASRQAHGASPVQRPLVLAPALLKPLACMLPTAVAAMPCGAPATHSQAAGMMPQLAAAAPPSAALAASTAVAAPGPPQRAYFSQSPTPVQQHAPAASHQAHCASPVQRQLVPAPAPAATACAHAAHSGRGSALWRAGYALAGCKHDTAPSSGCAALGRDCMATAWARGRRSAHTSHNHQPQRSSTRQLRRTRHIARHLCSARRCQPRHRRGRLRSCCQQRWRQRLAARWLRTHRLQA